MKRIETFISEDGKEFNDGKLCAEHELNDPLIKERLIAAISSEHRSAQRNWCGGYACACMGCINGAIDRAGFTKYHWQVWMEKYREETSGEWSDYDECQVVVTDTGSNRKEVLTWLKNKTGLSYIDITSAITTGKFVFKSGILYRDAELLLAELAKMGASASVEETNNMFI